eukprot:NODE_1233_length_943_cov_99.199755_g1187_i0.p3 GENE.NODE_1233_length_943_cov_99.199755_g1187_i0~~NODE_1233_length_943_cov_99.199755_g1187_i0.p3  ORF type:complete len:113 (-),score=23.27 NODE_1233_length_943_cov_99.199755_g1187_i0:169-507(-)
MVTTDATVIFWNEKALRNHDWSNVIRKGWEIWLNSTSGHEAALAAITADGIQNSNAKYVTDLMKGPQPVCPNAKDDPPVNCGDPVRKALEDGEADVAQAFAGLKSALTKANG